jgi:hypothetical protein
MDVAARLISELLRRLDADGLMAVYIERRRITLC